MPKPKKKRMKPTIRWGLFDRYTMEIVDISPCPIKQLRSQYPHRMGWAIRRVRITEAR